MFTLDTNILIAYFDNDKKVVEKLLKWHRQRSHFFISVINEIEILSLPKLTSEEINKIERFLREFTIIPLDSQLGRISAKLRRKYKLSLGDSVIAATASITDSTLVTLDKEIIKKLRDSKQVKVKTIKKVKNYE